MRVLLVVDSIVDIKNKIEKIRLHYGNNIIFIVKANLVKIFKTFNYSPNAIYVKNSANVLHQFMTKTEVQNTIIYYTSLKLDNNLISNFTKKIGTGKKVVNVMPKYNFFEKIWHTIYLTYVKILFKNKDSLTSPKLQYLPKDFVYELVNTHIGNRLFELNENVVTNIYVEDKQINKSLKQKMSFNKSLIIPLIFILSITFVLILNLMLFKINFLVVLIYIALYFLDIIISTIIICKKYFDNRFFK